MFKKILKIFGWLFLIAFLFFTLAFTTEETNKVRCEEIEVLYDGSQVISLGDEEIINIIKNVDRQIIGKNMNQINSEYIELELEKNQTIEMAEVYKNIRGEGSRCRGSLTVLVKHREPVVRVISGEEDYFLDKNMAKIPASTKYSVNVLVVTGDIKTDSSATWLVPLVRYIGSDQFWDAQIEQIFVSNNQELIMTPLVGGNLIEFGSPDDYQEKLANLKAFYENVMVQNNWNKYKSISVKYKNQVIGTKR